MRKWTILLIIIVTILLLKGGIAFSNGKRFLGVAVRDHQYGVIIMEVYSDSPATNAMDISTEQTISLEPKDIIQSVNKERVTSPAHFAKLLLSGPPIAIMDVWDARNKFWRKVLAVVGPKNEAMEFLNSIKQRAQGLSENQKENFEKPGQNSALDRNMNCVQSCMGGFGMNIGTCLQFCNALHPLQINPTVPYYAPNPGRSPGAFQSSPTRCLSNCTNAWVRCNSVCRSRIILDQTDITAQSNCRNQCDSEKMSCETMCR